MTDRTDRRDFSQKKSSCVSAVTLEVGDFDGTNAIEVFNLPERAFVTNVTTIAEEAGQVGLTLKIEVGADTVIATGGADVVNDPTTAAYNKLTLTGKNVKVTPIAAPTQGKFVVIVQYIEYSLGTGHFTKYSN